MSSTASENPDLAMHRTVARQLSARACGVGTRLVRLLQPTHTRKLSVGVRAAQSVVVRSQDEMEALGARLSRGRRGGDVIFLRGDLGCGKTCFARGFIRAMASDPTLHVTSPTYLLVNTYDELCEASLDLKSNDDSPIIHHMDLYRLDEVSDVDAAALGLTAAFANGISLVEWPQRLLAAGIPAERLEVDITYNDSDLAVRHVSFTGFGERWRELSVV